MSALGSPVLEARSLEKRFQLDNRRVLRAVDGVDLVVHEGESLAIVGESGSGKTTLARCLAGLLAPTEGAIIFEHTDIAKLRGQPWKEFRRQVQPIFQDPFGSLDPRWPIAKTIAEGLESYGVGSKADRAARVAELMHHVGLPTSLQRRKPHELSGGQCQRVGIAAALALEPKVLIADEPVSALDVSVRAQVLNLLARLQQDLKLTLILITHDMTVVEHISDRVAVMYLGRIVELGPALELLRAPIHPYTKALVASIPRPDPRRRVTAVRLKGEIESASSERAISLMPTGCRFHPRCPIAVPECSSIDPPLVAFNEQRLAACTVEANRLAAGGDVPAGNQSADRTHIVDEPL
jgi:oligopeptide/dipeptide ABC transporter ATP-binding protein